MKVVPHLTFDGNCREVFEFYQALFSGSLEMTTFGESPAAQHVPEDWKNRIVHATLTLANSELAGADVSPDEFRKAEGLYLILEPENVVEAERLFQSLSEKGQVLIPLQEMFWSVAYGSVIDKFGTPWEINCIEGPNGGS